MNMENYNEKLSELQEQIARKNQLEYLLKKIQKQEKELEERVNELEQNKFAEQADVDKLEGKSLASMLYTITGKKQEKLLKEQEEAYSARQEYEAAFTELTDVQEQRKRYTAELGTVRNAEQRYRQVLEEKAQAVKALNGAEGSEISRLEETLSKIQKEQKEVQEAVDAGQSALSTAESILSSLDSAHGWGVYDMLGGGLIADIAKHDKLEEAQRKMENLQRELKSFQRELTDVSSHAEVQIEVSGFMKFADYFFDGFLVDWMVQDKIDQSISQIQNIRKEIETILAQLKKTKASLEAEANESRTKREQFIKKA